MSAAWSARATPLRARLRGPDAPLSPATCPEVRPTPPPLRRPWTPALGRLALAVCLSLAPAPALAAPAASERDLAYERAVQAEEAGDHAAAADHYERAFQLTAPAETGPRLLFLRSSVAARLRAFDGTRDAESHLCPARRLLRDHLGAMADLARPTPATDPSLAERDSLTRIERQIASTGTACTSEPGVIATPGEQPGTVPPPEPIRDQPAPADPLAQPPPVTSPVGPAPPSPPRSHITRNLRITGGAALGLGAAGLAMMTAGILSARHWREQGEANCHAAPDACHARLEPLVTIRKNGRIANVLIATGATLGALGLVTGIALLAVSKRPARSRVAVTPNLTGLTLSARF